MAIGWMIKVDVTGDGYKDSVRGYAVAIRNRDEAMAAAREASGERVVEVEYFAEIDDGGHGPIQGAAPSGAPPRIEFPAA